MADESKKTRQGGELTFDRSFWPNDAKTLVFDLNDLWEKFEDQASNFVAEALVDDPPWLSFHFRKGEAVIECTLWFNGGDVLVLRQPISEIINESESQIMDWFESQDDDEKIIPCVKSLQKLRDQISELIERCKNPDTGKLPKRKRKRRTL